jgi:hypothetical protein
MRPAAQEITREDLTMEHFGPLLERNRHFATTNAREGASILARHPGPGLVRSGTILSATITVARQDS